MFGELEVPILADLPLVKDLSLGLAYRYSDYSTLGGTDSYSGRLQWVVNDLLRFRAQYAHAVRVPNIGELFSPAGENFAPVNDPCNGVTAVTPGQVAINCRANPLIAARIANQGVFALTQPELQGTGGFSGGGNPALQPEESNSLNVGAIATHDFGGPGRVNFSVDWWRIDIGSQIATLGRQATIDACYDVDPAQFPTTACNFVVRDNVGLPFAIGAITEVNSTFQNFDQTSYYEGVDVAAGWQFGLDEFFGSMITGDMSLRVAWTHNISNNADARGDEGAVGDASSGGPEDKVQFGAVYSNGPISASWETSYLGDMTASFASSGRFAYKLGAYTVHDVRLGWDVTDTANVYIGSNNLFDEEAPIVLSGVPGNTTGTDTNASFYDPIGRTFYAGVRLRY